MSADPSPGARTEALINLADRLANQPLPPPTPARRWPAALVGALLVAAIVVGVASLADRGGEADLAGGASQPGAPAADDDATTTSVGEPPATVVAQAAVPVPTDATTTAAPSTTDTASDTTSDPTTTTSSTTSTSTSTTTGTAPAVASAGPTVPAAAGTEQPVRWAEFTGGKVYLRGSVPDQATADELRSKAALVVGDANVIVEYVIDPDAPRPPSAPLYVRDSVLFDPGSSLCRSRRAACSISVSR
jgi:hypothetical protein